MKGKRFQVNIQTEWCKGCQFCIEFCPGQVLYKSPELNRRGYNIASADSDIDCLGCGICEMLCPELAISIVPLEEERYG